MRGDRDGGRRRPRLRGGRGTGRIRLGRVLDSSAGSIVPFVREVVAPGSLIITDGLPSYNGLQKLGYEHRKLIVRDSGQSADTLLPRVHRVASLLKRWLLGTHQGAVERKHLPYYVDEFTFRFNRRMSQRRGMLFFRLAQQALAVDPAPYRSLVGGSERSDPKILG